MKNTTLFLRKPALVLAFLVLHTFCLDAQYRKGDVFVTLGGAASFAGMNGFFGFYSTSSNQSTIKPFSSPALCVNADYIIAERLSIGGCFSWQQMGYKFDNYVSLSYNYPSPPPPGQSWTDTYNRYNAGARVLYYFINTSHVNMYLGARAGYTFWTRSSTNRDPAYDYSPADKYHTIFMAPFSLQSVLGLRYMFNENLGLNAEIAVGAPYALMLGVCGSFEGLFPAQHVAP